jgi:hypothetical protein
LSAWLVIGSGLTPYAHAQSAAPTPSNEIRLRSGSFVPSPGVDASFASQLKDLKGSEFSASGLSANADAIRGGELASLAPPATRTKSWTPRDSRDPGALHGLVQLPGPISLERRNELRSRGIHLWAPYAGAYAATIKQGTDIAQIQSDGVIRWAGPLPPAAKIDATLAQHQFGEWAKLPDGRIKLLVRLFPDVSAQLAATIFDAIKVSAKDQHIDNVWVVDAEPSLIEKLAELDMVQNIQQFPPPPRPLDATVLKATHADVVQNAITAPDLAITYKGLAGRSVKVGVADFGVYGLHPDFSASSASRVVHPRVAALDTSAHPNVHGTHTAAIIGSGGLKTNTPPYSLRGFAPNVQLGDYQLFVVEQDPVHTEFNRALETDGMDLTNHSYTQSLFGTYDQTALTIDREIHGGFSGINGIIADRPQVWAVGNNGSICTGENQCRPFVQRFGYYSVFTSAKNSISVGSIDANTGRPSVFSSIGPTLDGRVKPDIVAPGCIDSRAAQWKTISAAEPVQALYGGLCGTSEAAPVVSGTLALMLEKYRLAKGSAASLGSADAKAILVLTADEVTASDGQGPKIPGTKAPLQYSGTPNFVTGFGVIDSLAAVTLAGAMDRWFPASAATTLSHTGEELHWCLEAPAGVDLIKVVIAWDDDVGVTAAELGSQFEPVLVNDLDLSLSSPSGTAFLPWHVDRPVIQGVYGGDPNGSPVALPYYQIDTSSVPVATRTEDHVNNVEMISVKGAEVASGRWQVSVKAFGLKSPPQRFAIAATLPLLACSH